MTDKDVQWMTACLALAVVLNVFVIKSTFLAVVLLVAVIVLGAVRDL